MTQREPQRNTTEINNRMIEDERMSLKAKGVLMYLCSRPENSQFSIARLSKVLKEGDFAMRSAVKELINFGYLEIKRVRTDGKFSGTVWKYSDCPKDSKTPNTRT